MDGRLIPVNERVVSLSIFANVLNSKHDDAARTLHRTPQRETIALGDPGMYRIWNSAAIELGCLTRPQ